jgi:uncharacterized cupin superfamily protein
VGYTIFQAEELEFVPRAEGDPRSIASLSEALSASRANVWRYPPGAQGKRHRDLGQEEVFVVLEGTLTVDLAERRSATRWRAAAWWSWSAGRSSSFATPATRRSSSSSTAPRRETGKSEFFDPVP